MSEGTAAALVVVGVDGSEPSKQALRWARFIARASGAHIQAVAAWYIPPVAVAGWPSDFDPERDTKTALQDAITDVLGSEPDVSVQQVVVEGNAAQVLIAASEGAYLLVVGSRGHGGFAGLLLGSVSSACAEHADCPVLVIHGDNPPPPDPA